MIGLFIKSVNMNTKFKMHFRKATLKHPHTSLVYRTISRHLSLPCGIQSLSVLLFYNHNAI